MAPDIQNFQHIRRVPFALTAVSLGLLVPLTFPADPSFRRALDELSTIEALRAPMEHFLDGVRFHPSIEGEPILVKLIVGDETRYLRLALRPGDKEIYQHFWSALGFHAIAMGIRNQRLLSLEDFVYSWNLLHTDYEIQPQSEEGSTERIGYRLARENADQEIIAHMVRSVPPGNKVDEIEPIVWTEVPDYIEADDIPVFLREHRLAERNPKLIWLQAAGFWIPVPRGKTYKRQDLLTRFVKEQAESTQMILRDAAFSEAFPDLQAFVSDLASVRLEQLQEHLERRRKESAERVDVLGLDFPASQIAQWGVPIVLSIQLYFLVHLCYVARLPSAASNKQGFAWVVFYGDWLSQGLVIFSIAIVPAVSTSLLCCEAWEFRYWPLWRLFTLASWGVAWKSMVLASRILHGLEALKAGNGRRPPPSNEPGV